MVLPEGSNETRARRGSTGRRALFGIAALVLAGGAIALGTLTDPAPEAVAEAEQTETTRVTRPQPPSVDLDSFTPGQIEVGDPLDWTRGATLDDVYPVSVLEHEGWIYLFGSTTPYWQTRRASGLHAWRSEDGVVWEDLGTVIPEDVRVSSVSSSAYGLIALSSGREGEAFSVWRSSNGIEWARTPGPVVAGDATPILPSAVAATDRLIVVAGQGSYDPTELLSEKIESALGVEVDLSSYGWGQTVEDGQPAIVVTGPLGLPVLTITVAELDLTEGEQEVILGAFHGAQGDSGVWIRWDDSEWQHGTIAGSNWVESMAVLPEGGFVAIGWGTTGESGWTSFDGLDWSRLPLTARPPFSFEPWGNLLVGASSTGDPGLSLSRDGVEWEETPLYMAFPRPISWGLVSYAAGDDGLVASVEGWRHPTAQVAAPQPPVLVSGEIEMTIDFESNNVTVRRGEETSSFAMWTNMLPDDVYSDIGAGRVVFTDPDTGEEIGSFTYDELAEAESDYWGVRYHDDQLPYLAYSLDAEIWSIQTAEAAFGEETRVADLAVGNGQVVALVVPTGDHFRPNPQAGFTVWSARLP